MNEPRRIREDASNSAAAMLLRSAKADAAPQGGKKRALAMLGLEGPDTAPMREHVSPARRAELTSRLAQRTLKPRTQGRTAPTLFRHILDGGERSAGFFAKGRAGTAFVAGSQVLLIVALLLLSPMRSDHAPLSPPDAPRGIDIDLLSPPPAPPRPLLPPQAAAPSPERPKSTYAPAPARPIEEIEIVPLPPSPPTPLVEVESPKEIVAPPSAIEVGKPLAAAEDNDIARAFDANTMTRPKRIAGRDPAYTREAFETRVEGKALVQCAIGVSGETRDCHVVKGLPHMDTELLAAARTWRFSPAMKDGRPIAVKMVFPVRLALSK